MTNNIVIAGRLVADADLIYTNSGAIICNFTKPSRKAPSFSYGDIRLSQKN